MRPDVPDIALNTDEVIPVGDPLLNSLCQFDILYCAIVAADKTHSGSAYPASSAFKQNHTYPILIRLIDDDNMRHQLFPQKNDSQIATALNEAISTAQQQSIQYLMDGGGATIQAFEVSSTITRVNNTDITSSVSVVTKMENTR